MFNKTGLTPGVAILLMLANPHSSSAATILAYTGRIFTGTVSDHITATVTLASISPNTVYETDEGTMSGTLTVHSQYWGGTFDLWESYIQTDADGNVKHWNIRNDNTHDQNRGSYNCPTGTEYCAPNGTPGLFWIGDGTPSGGTFSIGAGTWLCTAECLPGSNMAEGASVITPESSTYGLMIIGVGLGWMLPKRRHAFRK